MDGSSAQTTAVSLTAFSLTAFSYQRSGISGQVSAGRRKVSAGVVAYFDGDNAGQGRVAYQCTKWLWAYIAIEFSADHISSASTFEKQTTEFRRQPGAFPL